MKMKKLTLTLCANTHDLEEFNENLKGTTHVETENAIKGRDLTVFAFYPDMINSKEPPHPSEEVELINNISYNQPNIIGTNCTSFNIEGRRCLGNSNVKVLCKDCKCFDPDYDDVWGVNSIPERPFLKAAMNKALKQVSNIIKSSMKNKHNRKDFKILYAELEPEEDVCKNCGQIIPDFYESIKKPQDQ